MSIHPTAVIDPTATLGENVAIGPYSVIGPHCHIGDHTKLGSHVVLEEYVTLGTHCQVASGAVLGGLPQDHNFGGETSYVRIGNHTVIRECVTINRATGEGKVTEVGDECMIMAYSHLAHNCKLGNGVILANNVQMAGYVEVGDYAFISGTCVFHQFVRIGRLVIMSGLSGSRQDIPPFAMTDKRPARVIGINKVGLKRRGFTLEQRTRIKQAFHYLWFSKLNTQQAIEAIRANVEVDENVEELIQFVQSSKRGIYRPEHPTTELPEPHLMEV